jgi:hypothetical protein
VKLSCVVNKDISDPDDKSFKQANRKNYRKRLQIVTLAISFILAIAIISIAYLTSPDYLLYSDNIISLTENVDGSIIITFNDKVAGYDIKKYGAGDGTGYVYELTAWNTVFNQCFPNNKIKSMILNPDGEKVASVYYYSDGMDNVLIYGEDQNPDGGAIPLPRLLLGYYFIIVVLLAILCGVFLFIFRKKEKKRNILVKVSLLPISYLFSHLCIKGLKTTSYMALRDFLIILLLVLPIYCLLLLSINLYRSQRSRSKLEEGV